MRGHAGTPQSDRENIKGPGLCFSLTRCGVGVMVGFVGFIAHASTLGRDLALVCSTETFPPKHWEGARTRTAAIPQLGEHTNPPISDRNVSAAAAPSSNPADVIHCLLSREI